MRGTEKRRVVEGMLLLLGGELRSQWTRAWLDEQLENDCFELKRGNTMQAAILRDLAAIYNDHSS